MGPAHYPVRHRLTVDYDDSAGTVTVEHHTATGADADGGPTVTVSEGVTLTEKTAAAVVDVLRAVLDSNRKELSARADAAREAKEAFMVTQKQKGGLKPA